MTRRWGNIGTVTVGGLLLLGVVAVVVAPSVRAEIPVGDPTFSDPLDFTNVYFPFEPGTIKVFTGKEGPERLVLIETHFDETRVIDWDGALVECAILVETEFEDGDLVEISYNYFATADDGSVYYLGEIVNDYEDGEIVGHDGSWLVGGPVGDDPAETETVPDPLLFLPGNPEPGDVFVPEGDETAEILSTSKRLRTPAGHFEDVLEILEVEDGGAKERKYYALGVGLVMEKGDGARLALVSSTLTGDDD